MRSFHILEAINTYTRGKILTHRSGVIKAEERPTLLASIVVLSQTVWLPPPE